MTAKNTEHIGDIGNQISSNMISINSLILCVFSFSALGEEKKTANHRNKESKGKKAIKVLNQWFYGRSWFKRLFDKFFFTFVEWMTDKQWRLLEAFDKKFKNNLRVSRVNIHDQTDAKRLVKRRKISPSTRFQHKN